MFPLEPFTVGKWSVVEKTRDIPATRNPMRLKDNPHKAISEHGIRKKYTDYKVCVLQVLEAAKQTPPPASPFALDGGETFWVQTTIQVNEDGTLPFSELPGMFPCLYTFDTFWEIPKRIEGQQLRGVTLGVAQYIVGTFELEFQKRPGTTKTYIEKEPPWLNVEAFRAASVLLKEVSSCYHQEDLGVMDWGHGFVYHPSEINFTRILQARLPQIPNSGRWVHISALVEHLYSVKHEGFDYLPFHTRGFVRMVPKPHWAAMLILASIMDTDIQMACDKHGFVWVRTTVCDVKRPCPAFTETLEDVNTGDPIQVKGDGNIDYRGDITLKPFGYVVCTMQEIHEAFDTRIARGKVPTDTFISFTPRYPEIFFRSNHVPKTPGLLVVKFDTWTAFRHGAMACRTNVNQWALTTGIPLESIVLVRDHVGSYLDPSTLDAMTWSFLPPRPAETNLLIDVEQGICIMPTMERWHCVLTDTEKDTSPGLHLFDWKPYQKGWGDPYLSLRKVDQNPPDKALTLSEWNGMKIWQIATIPPATGELDTPETWRYSQSGINYLTDSIVRDVDRSRTPARDGKGKGDPKGKGSGKKGKKPAKVIGTPEGEEVERVGKRYFPGPATLPEAWRDKKPEELVMSGPIDENPGRATMAFKQGPNGIPIFRRTWLISDAPVRGRRVLENKAGDPRLWDPKDTEFWSVCQQVPRAEDEPISYLTLSPGENTRCRLCPSARSNELVPCCWCESWVHWRCSYTVKSGRACASHFHVTNPLDKVIVTRSDDEVVPSDQRGVQVLPDTFYPKASKGTLKPSDLMIGLETYWAYKHAWRGAGYYYRKGDHQPLTKGGAPYLANALSIVESGCLGA